MEARVQASLDQLGLSRPLPATIFTCRTDTWDTSPPTDGQQSSGGGNDPWAAPCEDMGAIDRSIRRYFGEGLRWFGLVNVAITTSEAHGERQTGRFVAALCHTTIALYAPPRNKAIQSVDVQSTAPAVLVPLVAASVTDIREEGGLRIFTAFRDAAPGSESRSASVASRATTGRFDVAGEGAREMLGGGSIVRRGSVVVFTHPRGLRLADFRAAVRDAAAQLQTAGHENHHGDCEEAPPVDGWDKRGLALPNARFAALPPANQDDDAAMASAAPDRAAPPPHDTGLFFDRVSAASARSTVKVGKMVASCLATMPITRVIAVDANGSPADPLQRCRLVAHLSRHPFVQPLNGVSVAGSTVTWLTGAAKPPTHVPLTGMCPLAPGRATELAAHATSEAIAAQLSLAIAHAHARGVVVGPILPARVGIHRVKRRDAAQSPFGTLGRWGNVELAGVGFTPAAWADRRKSLETLAFLSPAYLRQWHVHRPGITAPVWHAADDWWSLGALLFWMRTGSAVMLADAADQELARVPLNAMLSNEEPYAAQLLAKCMSRGWPKTAQKALEHARGGALGAPLSGSWTELLFPAAPQAMSPRRRKKAVDSARDRTAHRAAGEVQLGGLIPDEIDFLQLLLQCVELPNKQVPHCTFAQVARSVYFQDGGVDLVGVFAGGWPVPLLFGKQVLRAPDPASPLPVPPGWASPPPAKPKRAKSASRSPSAPPRSQSRSRTPARQRVLLAALLPSAERLGAPPSPAVDASKAAIEQWIESTAIATR